MYTINYLKRNIVDITIFLLGVSLAVFQISINRSLWLDEALLALNVIKKSPYELLFPLDLYQVAPILFLQIEKGFVSILGPSEFALRLFPLFCFVISLFLFHRIALIITGRRIAAAYALLLFVLCPSILYYSSEVKQYMSDVFVCILLIYLTIRPYDVEERRMCDLAIAGTIAIFLSNISILVLAVIGLALVYNSRKQIYKLKRLPIPFSCWLVTFLVYYYTFIKGHPTEKIMLSFWAGAFMPKNFLSAHFWLWSKDAFQLFFDTLPGFRGIAWLTGLFYLTGVAKLIRDKNYQYLLVLSGPVVLHLLLSMLKLYPFAARLLLYQVPLIMITLLVGMEFIIAF